MSPHFLNKLNLFIITCNQIYWIQSSSINQSESEWPSLAYIEFNETVSTQNSEINQKFNNESIGCAGTLIDNRRVLLSAHCIPESVVFKQNESNTLIDFTMQQSLESRITVYLGFNYSCSILINKLSSWVIKTSVRLAKKVF